MKDNIRLFIEEQEVEFYEPPKILFNYSVNDTNNPTVVKNSYTKTIEVKGTNQNNIVFGHIYQYDRVNGIGFNANKKASFVLYWNSEIYEKGYCKLDKVEQKTPMDITYYITLYGGVGQFLQTLKYGNEDNEDTLTLADLKYKDWDLGFKINATTVNEAWTNITNTNKKWSVINFAPCYNGIPSDNFDANKFLIDTTTVTEFPSSVTKDGVVYNPVNNYILGETSDGVTEWECRDLRSYMQRPVINVSEVLYAIGDYRNNGGWYVQWDNDIANSYNPYYEDAWMTLPMIKDLNTTSNSETTVTDYTTVSDTYDYEIKFNGVISDYSSIQVTFQPTLTGTSIYDTLYTSTQNGDGFGAVAYQLLGYDNNGSCIAMSDVQIMGADAITPIVYKQTDEKPQKYVKNAGKWVKQTDGTFKFATFDGSLYNITFTLASGDMSKIVLRAEGCYHQKQGKHRVVNGEGRQWTFLYPSQSATTTNTVQLWTSPTFQSVVGITSTSTNFLSNTEITQEKLLSTPFSPADFLLSYCKLFGYYIWCNPSEESDMEGYDKGVIHISTRSHFYTDEIVNIDDKVDLGKTQTLVPTVSETKYYEFNVEQNESEVNNSYKETYGGDFGRQVINTNYNFDNEVKSLYETSVFKGGVSVLEKDKFFNAGMETGTPPIILNGFSYHLFKKNADGGYDTSDDDCKIATIPISAIGSYGDNYDVFPKLQCHTEGNSPAEGSYVLLFYNGKKSAKVYYNLTDDVTEMNTLNEGKPCWILRNTTADASAKKSLPFFSRYYILNDNIIHSWDFANSKELFLPNTNTAESPIYPKYWKSYIADMYNENAKKLTIYVKFDEKPVITALRKFYWFRNALWRLNSVKDWNVSSRDTVLCEFIKVMDTKDYEVERIRNYGTLSASFREGEITDVNNTYHFDVYSQAGGTIYFSDGDFPEIYGVGVESGNDYTIADAEQSYWREWQDCTGTSATFSGEWEYNESNEDILWTVPIGNEYDTTYVDVLQKWMPLISSPSLYTEAGTQVSFTQVPKAGGNFYLQFRCNEEWRASTVSGDAAVLTSKGGTEHSAYNLYKATIIIGANTTGLSRAIKIKLKGTGSQAKTITLTQLAS